MSKVPTTDSIRAAMQIASASVEAAEYLRERVIKMVKHALKKDPELQGKFVSAVTQFADSVKRAFSGHDESWLRGIPPSSSAFANIQESLAEEALRDLGDQLQHIRMDWAVSKDGQYIRGYAAKDGEVSQEQTESLDRLFNDSLAKNNYVITDGYISPASNLDARLSQQEVRDLITNGSFESYMKNKGIQVELNSLPYPGEEAEQTMEQNIEPQQPAGPEDEAPQAGSGNV